MKLVTYLSPLDMVLVRTSIIAGVAMKIYLKAHDKLRETRSEPQFHEGV